MAVYCFTQIIQPGMREEAKRIFEEILLVASGKKSKSELSGVGEEEFAPWMMGPVL